jgi:Arc/MetJ-type ribon-helix-helix transcriptional regulator
MKIGSKEIEVKYSTKPVQVRLTKEAISILTEYIESEGGTVESASAAVNELIERSSGKAVQIKTQRLHADDLKELQSLLTPLLASIDTIERPFTRSYLVASDIDSLTSEERRMRADIIKLRDQTMRVLDQISFERLTLAKLKTADIPAMSESILGLLNCLKSMTFLTFLRAMTLGKVKLRCHTALENITKKDRICILQTYIKTIETFI